MKLYYKIANIMEGLGIVFLIGLFCWYVYLDYKKPELPHRNKAMENQITEGMNTLDRSNSTAAEQQTMQEIAREASK